ncbi:MAG: class I SAM-dependent methyltransferase, partial [Gemmatimonadota bacterium]|nr:class I SAM-dependent methyltransferase [Gemmatimonadota bacterium]
VANATVAIERLRPFVERARTGHPLAHAPRPLGDAFPWDFDGRARTLARLAKTILDVGTGPGSRLAAVLEESEAFVVATDRRSRHMEEARANLGDRASLVRADARDLPFAPASFDLILIRRQPFEAEPFIEAVKPGGAILAEQVHARNWHELRAVFPRMTKPEDRYEKTKRAFRRAGFEFIDVRALDRPVAFAGLGELAYTIAASPWIVPDFSLEEDIEALLELEAKHGDERGILLTRSRYLIEVRRPLPIE